MQNKIKHLELIQHIIDRMTRNSFSLKGWSVVLVSALFALAASRSTVRPIYFAFPYFPAIAFWILDAYFVRQEQLFRRQYDSVRAKTDSEIDFSMDTSPFLPKVRSLPATAFSKTLALFHGVVVLTITCAFLASLLVSP